LYVNMRWLVIVVIHADDDSEKRGKDWHLTPRPPNRQPHPRDSRWIRHSIVVDNSTDLPRPLKTRALR
jgi:hypothetical protein